MVSFPDIPEPVLFNPLKHDLRYIQDYVDRKSEEENYPGSKQFIRELRHLGTCVMDIYNGDLALGKIYSEVKGFLEINGISGRENLRKWVGTGCNDFKIVQLSDTSQWMLKYYDNAARYAHIFPARSSRYTFRIKANTLKSAILYLVLIGKDFISEDDLNKTRALAGLSPVKEIADAEAVTEMIEILRNR